MLMSTDDALKAYLGRFMQQLHVHKLVMAILSTETRTVLERWQFDIIHQEASVSATASSQPKTEAQVQSEIQSIIRQITASVTFLPVLTTPTTFNLLVYADQDTEAPMEWGESDGCVMGAGSEQVKLRSFSTGVHQVEAMVSYRLDE